MRSIYLHKKKYFNYFYHLNLDPMNFIIFKFFFDNILNLTIIIYLNIFLKINILNNLKSGMLTYEFLIYLELSINFIIIFINIILEEKYKDIFLLKFIRNYIYYHFIFIILTWINISFIIIIIGYLMNINLNIRFQAIDFNEWMLFFKILTGIFPMILINYLKSKKFDCLYEVINDYENSIN